jgi:hypothetical protein
MIGSEVISLVSRVYLMPIGETVVLTNCHHVIEGLLEASQVERESVNMGGQLMPRQSTAKLKY